MYLPPVTHVAGLLTIRRERRLPAHGEILVRPGDRVEANDVVGRAPRNTRHRILDVARLLRIEPAAADSLLRVDAGVALKKGATLAEKRTLGLFRRRVRVPFDGEVIAAGDGRLLMASRDHPFELRAFLPGTVVDIQSSRSVLIEAHGVLIQAKWGSGRKAFGVLRVAATDPTQPLLAQSIDVGYQDVIVAVGGAVDHEALQAAAAAHVRGIVAGSMPGELIDFARGLPFPVLITEGFGERIMPAYSWELLIEHNGRETALDANPTDRFAGSRPELIIPLPTMEPPPPVPVEGEPLVIGKRVRMLRKPHAGEIGVIVEIGAQQQRFASGLLGFAVTVELDDGAAVVAPRNNVEVYEDSLPA